MHRIQHSIRRQIPHLRIPRAEDILLHPQHCLLRLKPSVSHFPEQLQALLRWSVPVLALESRSAVVLAAALSVDLLGGAVADVALSAVDEVLGEVV